MNGRSIVPLPVLLGIAVLISAVSHAGDREPAPYDTALEAYRAGRYAAVIELLESMPELNAGEANLLGWSYLRSGRQAMAIDAFERSVASDPETYDSYCGLGYAHMQLGELERSVERFERGVAGMERDIECRTSLASVLWRLGRMDRAAEVYTRILELDPGHSVARSRLVVLSKPLPGEDTGGKIEYVARGGYFWMRGAGHDPSVVYVKGVNVSFGMPGKYVTEFPTKEEAYLDWFRKIDEMNANLIRVYTILPPEFYSALKLFNHDREPGDRLLLIQGIWATLPPSDDFREPAYIEEVRGEIRDAVNVVHGNADLPHRYGHAYGVYRADISEYLLAFIFGREWEPGAVAAYIEEGEGGDYRGEFIGIAGANPMEKWLAEMLDHLATIEDEEYDAQRPLAWMSWPPLDPLYHPSEATYNESLVFRAEAGEDVPNPLPTHKTFDDDAVGLDETRLAPTGRFRAGIFASHHVYPYYPDFLRNDARYSEDPDGLYHGYLEHLKGHYRDIPLLVSEYGVPTSRGIARFHADGLGHGGHTESEQAAALKRMTADIRDTGCAGGIVFSWIDEWLKRNWMVSGTESRDRMWLNAMDPEENYGLLAMGPARSNMIGGEGEEWAGATVVAEMLDDKVLNPVDDGHDGARLLRGIRVDSDAGYLYVRLDVGSEVDWSHTAYLLAIDTYGDAEGDHLLPFDLGEQSDVGFEFVVLLHGENSRMMVDDRYSRTMYDQQLERFPGLTGYKVSENFSLTYNDNGIFNEMLYPHVRKFGRDGTVYPQRIYDAGKLRHGRVSEDSLADWYHDPGEDTIELRIPWGMLYVSDPSRMEILKSENEKITTDGFRVMAVSYRPVSSTDSNAAGPEEGSRVVDSLPENSARMKRYTWPGWDRPEFTPHLKAAYGVMKEQFSSLEPPEQKIKVPPEYDFTSVITGHYDSMDEFLSRPDIVTLNRGGDDDLYGLAMANMVLGFARDVPFYLRDAEYYLGILERSCSEPRVGKAATAGLAYIRAVLGEGIPAPEPAGPSQARPFPVEIERFPPPQDKIGKIVIGRSAIRLRDGDKVKAQVDRVSRDWLLTRNFGSAPWILVPDRIVPWHEGEMIRKLLGFMDAKVDTVWGTPARKFGDQWYTPDAEGVFRFRVTSDKIYSYPTNFIVDRNNAIINDTHGVSAMVWDAVDADLVVGCGDFPGKAEAAWYLADRGVNVYMPTDRFLSILMGTRTDGVIIGSAPVKDTAEGAVIGDQPITIDPREPVVVSNTDGRYPMQYYDTPYRYFTALRKYIGRKMHILPVDIPEYGKGSVVVDEARRRGAALIGIRVWGKEEHDAVADWLREDAGHRAVLFHTVVYPEGYRLFEEFPEQTSFGDIRPQFED